MVRVAASTRARRPRPRAAARSDAATLNRDYFSNFGSAAYAHTSLGQHRTAIELAHRALVAPAGGADNAELRIWVQQSLVRVSYAAGDYQTAVSAARATLDILAGYPADKPIDLALLTPVVPSVGIRGFLALALSALGELDDALAEAAEAVRIAEKVNRSPELARANYCLGRTVLEQGNAEQAVEYLERAFALTREWEPTTRVRVLEFEGSAMEMRADALEEHTTFLRENSRG